MEIINSVIEKYCQEHSELEPEILRQINRNTHIYNLKPRMLSGHFQGRILSMISHLVKPKFILEIGTFTGYSAICLAEGLIEDGKIITIEANEELQTTILSNFRLAGLEEKAELKIGEAKNIIPKLDHAFDIVFIDADKLNYSLYYDLVFEKINMGGLIISDNVLWDGKVAENSKNDTTTKALRDFNKKLKEDIRTEKVLLPIRDGLFVSRKIK